VASGGSFRSVEAGEEPLDLLSDLVTRRQLLVGCQQAPRLVGPGEGVVLLLEAGDDLGHLRVVREVRRDLGVACVGGDLERVQFERQPGRVLDALEQHQRGTRVVELREVVGHVRDVPGHVVAGLPQPHLEQGLGRGGDAELAAPRVGARHQRGTVRVLGDRQRSRVRHRHRHRAHRGDQVDAEALHHRTHRAGERLPAVVRLGPAHQQVRALELVTLEPDHEPGRVVALVVVAHERDRRPPGAVVVEHVDVERRHDGAGRFGGQVVDGEGAAVAGVEEALEGDHHRQLAVPLESGHVVDDVHELHP